MRKINGLPPDYARPVPQKDRQYSDLLLGALTAASCILLCRQHHPSCYKPGFTSVVEHNLPTRDEEHHSKAIDISRIRTFSFLLLNDGPNPVIAQPELSADGETWDPFGELAYVIEPGGKRLFVLQFFLRYARLKFRNKYLSRDTVITVWFQGQS